MAKEINLLPGKYKNLKRQRKARRAKAAVFAGVVLIAAAAVYLPVYLINDLKSSSAFVESQIAGKKDVANYRKAKEELQKEIDMRNSVMEELLSGYTEWSGLLKEIGEQVPEGVALQSITYKGEGGIQLKGQALSYNLAAQFLVKLQNMDAIQEANPVTIAEEESGLFGFEIECIIQGGSDNDEAE